MTPSEERENVFLKILVSDRIGRPVKTVRFELEPVDLRLATSFHFVYVPTYLLSAY